MIFARAAFVGLVFTALVAPSVQALGRPERVFETVPKRVYFQPATRLEEIPVYSMAAADPQAMRGIEAEIGRLYAHAITLPSGAENRAFRTRIHLLEKRYEPLLTKFNAEAWEKLRLAVKAEWLEVQATLPAADA